MWRHWRCRLTRKEWKKKCERSENQKTNCRTAAPHLFFLISNEHHLVTVFMFIVFALDSGLREVTEFLFMLSFFVIIAWWSVCLYIIWSWSSMRVTMLSRLPAPNGVRLHCVHSGNGRRTCQSYLYSLKCNNRQLTWIAIERQSEMLLVWHLSIVTQWRCPWPVLTQA